MSEAVDTRAPQVEPAPATLDLSPFAAGPLALIALVQLVLQVATTGMYGLHAGDLVQLSQGRRLAWGYIDTMPLTPFLYRAMEELFGVSSLSLHLPAIAAGTSFIVVAAAMARESGGGRWAQGVAGLVAAFGPLFLGSARFLGPYTLDVLFVSLVSLVILRVLRTGDRRVWLWLGPIVGLGMLNKVTVAVWLASCLVALAIGRQRRVLWTWWLVAAGGVALAIFSPSLAWLISNREKFASFASSSDTSARSLLLFFLLPLIAATPIGTVFIVRGLAASRTPPYRARFGFLGPAFAIAAAIYFFGGAGAQWIPLLLPLTSVGVVVVEARSRERTKRWLVGGFAAFSLVMLPMTTSILPADVTLRSGIGAVFNLNFTIGYHDVARDVARAFHDLPEDEQQRATILTSTANEAAVIEYWRHELDVPQPISPENNYGNWGYGDALDDAPVLLVGFPESDAATHFDGCRTVASLGANGRPMDPNEKGRLIIRCDRPLRPWADTWPSILRFGRV